ncbi:Aldo/keto reductase [Schizopora paradoxa]|uniref:Aldo/keto reductase n=1 Tax=Schizopora paradoxa TaxID=27342 RepID=A0A0H2RQZ9_9AGAM|nr:Aldo/keto reductase [Schizopora paradoxa]
MSAVANRKLGDAQVFPIGFGAMGLSAFYGEPLPDEERFKLLDAVLESGCNYWDSADIYGDSEELLGKWFKRTGKRSSVFIASKFGFTPEHTVNGSPEYVKQAVESSLKKLGVDYIDLYYLHRPDTKTPIELTVGALAEFVKAGKIRNIGLSECSAATLKRAHAVHPIAALQVEYSPFTLDIEFPEVGLLKTARELGVTIIAYSPLGRGLLTGQITSPNQFSDDDFRKMIPRYSKENFPRILALVEGLKKVGDAHSATSGQVTLAWLLAQGNDIIPIPGTTKVKYLKENVASASISLTEDEVTTVRRMAENAEFANTERYPPGMQEQLYADTPELK